MEIKVEKMSGGTADPQISKNKTKKQGEGPGAKAPVHNLIFVLIMLA